jgi:hypothetical protein
LAGKSSRRHVADPTIPIREKNDFGLKNCVYVHRSVTFSFSTCLKLIAVLALVMLISGTAKAKANRAQNNRGAVLTPKLDKKMEKVGAIVATSKETASN